MIDKRSWVSVALGGCVALVAPAALAQYDEEEESSETPEPEASADSEESSQYDASASASTSGSLSASSSGTSAALAGDTTTTAPAGSDHDRFVGSFGIGYMGFRTMQIGAAGGGTATVEAPVIGARYWFDPAMGIDLGLGLSLAGGSTTTEAGDTTTDTDQPEPLAFIVHAGLPLVLAKGRHFLFEIVPEMNIGLASNTVEVGDEDVDLSGFHLDIGARAGAEIHFGFIDLPELALQAGVGLRYAMDSASVETDDTSASTSRYTFGTTVGDNPWNIFTANIAALYYFDD